MFIQTSQKRELLACTLKKVFLGVFAIILLTGIGISVATGETAAATNNTINFQARLESSTGAIAPDGDYNVEFKLYNASTSSGSSQGSCTGDANCLWTETRTGANVVHVANGYLTVNLGSVTAFPTTINWDQQLWLTMNIGGIGTPSWDGEMNPRLQLTAVPYAFKAGQLAQYNATTTYTSTLSLQSPTIGNQSFVIPDQAAAGTYNLCIQGSTACGFAASSGSGSYIDNQTSLQSSANFYIDGTGKAANFNATTALQTGGTTRIDASGNLSNIGNVAGTGTIQFSGTGTSYIMSSLGLGTTSPQTTGSALTLANSSWISSVDSAGTGYVNILQVNSNNEIQLGAALNIDGGIILPTDGGQMTFSDLPIDSSASVGTAESYTLRVGSTNALTIYGESNGAGGTQNVRVAIGSSIAPAYPLDVTGDINSSTGLRVAGTTVCTVSGCTAASGSGSYIQNQTSLQASSNFNISGTGIAATALQAPSFDTAAAGALAIGSSHATSIQIGNTSSTVTISATTGNAINIGNDGLANTINIGNTGSSSGAVVQTVNIANNTTGGSGSSFNIGPNTGSGGGRLQVGSGTLDIRSQGGTVSIAGNSSAQTVNIGNGTGATSVTIAAGTGGLSLGANGIANTIQIGNS